MISTSLDPLRRRFHAAAGPPDAFEHRARLYRAMYAASGGNNTFPLIAAFGALWARGYLRRAMQAGGALSAIPIDRPERVERWRRLNGFADAFRHLHQRVFAESAMLDHLASDADHAEIAARMLPGDLLRGLRHASEAALARAATSEADRRALFDALFRWEQEQAVGSRVIDAFAEVAWPLVMQVARRPIIRFAYFPATALLRFADFTSMDERIAQGARAYSIAAARGWNVASERLDQELRRNDWRPAVERAAACPLADWLAPAA